MVKASLRVHAPGLLTTVQDLGRSGYQHLGIPVSGALDPLSLRAANALVGNPSAAGALEVAYLGPTLVVEAESVRLAFVGAQATVDVYDEETETGGTRINTMQSVRLQRGQIVRVGSLIGSAVLYIAVEGGLDIAAVFGSVSTYIRGRIGGWQGRALVAGDRVPLTQNNATDRDECRLTDLDLGLPKCLRCTAGPQYDYFSKSEFESLFSHEYTVGAGSDRMGMRLVGRNLKHARGYNIISDGIAPGSIQIPGDGAPIVLLADRQTTGGYPKIATVISADLPALGRVPIGAKIRFELVTIEAAVAARERLHGEFDNLKSNIVPLPRTGADIGPLLFDHNLISGAIDAHCADG